MSGVNISSILPTDRNANLLRAVNKYGMNLADFAALTTTSRFTGFGNGTGYTVSSWISDGVFANLAAVQAVYPIVQSGSDKVDWVLLQSAIDFIIYGALDGAARGAMKRKLIIPAGHFLINRSLLIGYGGAGTPPVNLNANRYASITIEGEGTQVDPQQSGMPGTTIITEAYTYPGIVVSRAQQVLFQDFTLQGPYDSWLANNDPHRTVNNHDRSAWRPPGVADANWIGGAAVNIGIGISLYSNATAAAAYPARVLPSYFGGGTTTADFGGVGGTDISCENVNIRGFFIGIGRPHGDSNDEFIRFNKGIISNCTQSFVIGHSQARNNAITHTNIGGFHTAISSRGGLTGNSNLHGVYSNVHFGQGFQLFDHPQADWSGPLTLRDCYAESFFRLGNWSGRVKLDGCALSLLEQEAAVNVTYSHGRIDHLILDNTSITTRHGLMIESVGDISSRVEMVNGATINLSAVANYNNLASGEPEKVSRGQQYMQNLFTRPGFNNRRLVSSGEIMEGGYGNYLNYFNNENTVMTFLDQHWTVYASQFPQGDYPFLGGSNEMQGSAQKFSVPKITKWQLSVDVSSRSGFDLTCVRTACGDIKADVGDVFGFLPTGANDDLEKSTWFICVAVTTSTMTLRQLHNYWQASQYDYTVTNWPYYQVGAGIHLAEYICTRVRQQTRLFVGDVTSGSAVISNIRGAFQYGATDVFTAANFNDPHGMKVGDYFLHQEIERANTGGSGLKVHNRISAIDFTANTITLTENFNITRTNYPIVFYVKSFTA